MTKMLPKLIFFGNECLATGVTSQAPVLNGLIEAGYPVLALINNARAVQSRRQTQFSVESAAAQNNVPVFKSLENAELLKTVNELQPDIGILAAYGRIIPTDLIALFPHGIINIHPSLLPKHRGPTPIESVILSGDNQTGVSIMKLTSELDAGPVYAQSTLPLNSRETKQQLADKLLETGRAMLLDLLPRIINGSAVAVPQDVSKASYDKPITKADGQLDWHKPAEQLEKEIRAYAGWPKSYASFGGLDVVVTAAHTDESAINEGLLDTAGNLLKVGTSQGSLVIDRLVPAGKQEMTGAAFIAGYKDKLSGL